MIGDFRRSNGADNKTICVSMFWNADRQRCARIVFPARLRIRLQAMDYPALDDEMRLDAALSYAMFIAMRMSMGMRLGGDFSVWNNEWGALLDLEHDLPADTGVAAQLN